MREPPRPAHIPLLPFPETNPSTPPDTWPRPPFHPPPQKVTMFSQYLFVLAIVSPPLVYARGCSNSLLSTLHQTPSLALGYGLQLVTQNLTTPRHIVFDSAGNLLVAGDPAGITALILDEPSDGGCIAVREQKVVVENADLGLNHGISLSVDGKTLYASPPPIIPPSVFAL